MDKPTSKSSQQVLADFAALSNTSATEGDYVNFVDSNFRGEGLELEAVALTDFQAEPTFLGGVTDPLVKAFAQTVHGFWTQLIRNTNQTALCPEGTESGSCESSLIPLNHTFVVPGGRFREQCECIARQYLRATLSMSDRLLGLVLDHPRSHRVTVVLYRQ